MHLSSSNTNKPVLERSSDLFVEYWKPLLFRFWTMVLKESGSQAPVGGWTLSPKVCAS